MVQISMRISKEQCQLAIYNLALIDLLSLFENQLVESLIIYWISEHKNHRSQLQRPVAVGHIQKHLKALAPGMISVELRLSNGLGLDSNLTDEVFCSKADVRFIKRLAEQVTKPEFTASMNHVKPQLLGMDIWKTEELSA